MLVVGRNQPFQHREDSKLLSLLVEIKQNVVIVVVVVYGALFLAASKANAPYKKMYQIKNKKTNTDSPQDHQTTQSTPNNFSK